MPEGWTIQYNCGFYPGMNRIILLTIFTFSLVFTAVSATKNPGKLAFANRISNPPKIDGVLNEACWDNASVINEFTQYDPDYGKPSTQQSFVYIVYDDDAIYIGARLLDTAPDSILTQLGNRDDGGLNADWFGVEFDTYYNQLDAYSFKVTASGVQIDRRYRDHTFDAVWKSATNVTDEGWIVEMKIPYSAIRFPNEDEQLWGMQVTRSIRRNRETAMWALGVKGAANQQVYWGTLNGLTNIKPPLRLSLTPYFSIAGQHDQRIEDKSNQYSYSFGGGADVKYGINESFTLDMTLFPDFSQVKSDNKVKNLSAFETVYAEQRPFFQEAVDLFRKGGLFYSRRIGGTPINFYDVPNEMDSTEQIIDNPAQAKLLNALKISGRNNRGLAIGFLNAITNNTYATVEDTNGAQREILTDPFTNYNITVFDQALKNNSSVYLINTSVVRSNKYNDANVSGGGFNLLNKQNTWNVNGSGAISQVFLYNTEMANYEAIRGYKYYASIGKVSGNFHFNIYRHVMDPHYNDNDLGITQRNNFERNGINFRYNIYTPFWRARRFSAYLRASHETDYTTNKNLNLSFRVGANMTFLSYMGAWANFTVSPIERYDYYDPRTEGRYYIRPGYTNASLGFSSDYRKALALDGNIWFGYDQEEYVGRSFMIRPVVRVSDKLNFNYTFRTSITDNSKGYADTDTSGAIIYGQRDMTSYENVLSGRYMFKNNLSLSLWMRHYWYQGAYESYYRLTEDGRLEDTDSYDGNNDFNFNTFNVDLVFNWEFAPGSNLSLVWKNSILHEDQYIIDDFLDNFQRTMQSDQLNQLSLKVLYYLDYQDVFKGKG